MTVSVLIWKFCLPFAIILIFWLPACQLETNIFGAIAILDFIASRLSLVKIIEPGCRLQLEYCLPSIKIKLMQFSIPKLATVDILSCLADLKIRRFFNRANRPARWVGIVFLRASHFCAGLNLNVNFYA